MSNKLVRGVVTVLVSVLLIGYVGYHILRGSTATYPTEIVDIADFSENLALECWFVRGEQTLQTEQTGYLNYSTDEGEKITKGGVVAQVFAREQNITISRELTAVREQIADLQALNAEALAGAKPSAVTEKISAQMSAMMSQLNQGNLSALTMEREKLLLYFSQKQIITGELNDFSQRIAALRAQEADLMKQYQSPTGVVVAPLAGYFSATADGYERVLTEDILKKCTPEQLKSIQPEELPKNTIGKLVPSNVWYAACIIPVNQARLLTLGQKMTIILPDSETRMQVKVERINTQAGSSEAVLILCGTEINEKLVTTRHGTIQLELNHYKGYRINRSAVHIEKRTRTITKEDGTKVTEEVDVQGVYVVFGEQMRFREISPLYWGESFVICDANAKATADTTMMKQYDQVILEGKDFYDGKSIV